MIQKMYKDMIYMNKLIKSPMNYVGGKFKVLPQLLPLFPHQINTCVDLMCGGLNVGINVKSNKLIANDICKEVISLYNTLYNNDIDFIFTTINSLINQFHLSNSCINGYEYYGTNSNKGLGAYNKEHYIELRSLYNNMEDCFDKDIIFYLLIVYGFNNQIRFNSKNEFNMPVGKRDFNISMQNKLYTFTKALQDRKVKFTILDFKNFDITHLTSNDFVYLDPPYLLGCASYNEKDGWNLHNEKQIYKLCDDLNTNNIRFALSNVVEHKGKKNDMLIDWSKQYNIHYINSNYNNCNYHKKNKIDKTVEVLITNY